MTSAAVLSLAAPATAQYQPQPQYPQQYPGQQGQSYPYPNSQNGYPQYGYPQQGYSNDPVGQVIDQLLGNRYNVSDRQAVHQCARAAMAQAQSQYGGYGSNQQYGYNGQQYGNNGKQYGYNRFRVTSITDVQRRSDGLRVTGTLGYGGGYGGGHGNQGYGNQGYGNQGYGYPNGGGALTFRCNVDYRGAVTNVRVRDNGYGRY
jgi:hypothetical protein